MGFTRRFGLSKFGGSQEGSIADDGSKFSNHDRDTIDAVMAAFEGHTHVGGTALADPTAGPTLSLLTTGGNLEAGTDVFYRVSFIDAFGLETQASDEVSLATPDPVLEPDAPALNLANGGSLPAGEYFYALSFIQTDGSETAAGPVSFLDLSDPGTQGSIVVTLPTVPGDCSGVRVYRKGPNEADLFKLADITNGAPTYTDDGTVAISGVAIPFENNTNSANTITVDAPDPAIVGADPSAVKGWRIYRTFTSGDYGSAALVEEVVETVNQTFPYGGLVTTWDDVGDSLLDGLPLDISTTIAPPGIVIANMRDRGLWSSSTAYILHDVVYEVVSGIKQFYLNKTASTNHQPSTDAEAHWYHLGPGVKNVRYQGLWSNVTAYLPNDLVYEVVTGTKQFYLNHTASTNHQPSADAEAHWYNVGPGTGGGSSISVVVIDDTDSPYTATSGEVLLVNAFTAPVTVIPPVTLNAQVTVKKTDASANAVTLDPAGAATVDGAATYAFTTQYEADTVVGDGTNVWLI